MTKRRKILGLITLSIIGIMAYWLVISKLINFGQWPQILSTIQHRPFETALFLAAMLMLTGLNVFTETGKWHFLIQTSHKQPLTTSLKQTLGGMAMGTLSPGRIAEPVGKMWRLPPRAKYHALALSVFGSFLQNAVIMSMGTLSAFWMIKSNNVQPFFSLNSGNIAIIAVLAIAIILTVIWAKPLVKWLVRRLKMHRVLIGLNKRVLTLASMATLVRYLCYSLQMAIALIVLANVPTDSYVLVMGLVPLYYLLVTLVPSFILTDLGIRGSAAIIVFAPIIEDYTPIVIASFLVWMMNGILPAIIGLWWVSPFKKEC